MPRPRVRIWRFTADAPVVGIVTVAAAAVLASSLSARRSARRWRHVRRRGMSPLNCALGVGDAHEQRQQDVVGQQGGSAVADERERHARQRHDPGDAADDHERLHADDGGEPGGQQLLEGPLGLDGDAQPAAHHQQVGDDDRRPPQQAQLLAEGGEDEVVLDLGDAAGITEPQAGAGDLAPGQRERALDQLEALAVALAPRIEPDGDPVVHVGQQAPGRERSDREQQGADGQPGEPLGGDPQEHDEEGEEQHRGAEVLLADHHDERGRPGDQQGPEVPRFGQVERADLPGARGQAALAARSGRRRRTGPGRSWRTRRAGS